MIDNGSQPPGIDMLDVLSRDMGLRAAAMPGNGVDGSFVGQRIGQGAERGTQAAVAAAVPLHASGVHQLAELGADGINWRGLVQIPVNERLFLASERSAVAGEKEQVRVSSANRFGAFVGFECFDGFRPERTDSADGSDLPASEVNHALVQIDCIARQVREVAVVESAVDAQGDPCPMERLAADPQSADLSCGESLLNVLPVEIAGLLVGLHEVWPESRRRLDVSCLVSPIEECGQVRHGVGELVGAVALDRAPEPAEVGRGEIPYRRGCSDARQELFERDSVIVVGAGAQAVRAAGLQSLLLARHEQCGEILHGQVVAGNRRRRCPEVDFLVSEFVLAHGILNAHLAADTDGPTALNPLHPAAIIGGEREIFRLLPVKLGLVPFHAAAECNAGVMKMGRNRPYAAITGRYRTSRKIAKSLAKTAEIAAFSAMSTVGYDPTTYGLKVRHISRRNLLFSEGKSKVVREGVMRRCNDRDSRQRRCLACRDTTRKECAA